jgi:hypothetical protein
MRKQYHSRPGEGGRHVWDVERLLVLAQGQPVEHVLLADIREVHSDYWFADQEPTVLAVVAHARLIDEADLAWPILLDPWGGVMDGMHRVAKALLRGDVSIAARRLSVLPDPDFVGVPLEDLPYDR